VTARGKFACTECVALLRPGSAVHTKGGNGPCSFCGAPGCTGPMTPEQCQIIIDSSRGKRIVAGGDATLREHRLVRADRVGKYAHVLDVANRAARDEPWFTCRIQGETPGPTECYPAFPLSALEPYVVTRESLTARNEAFSAEVRSLPPVEKLRLAADFLDKGMAKQAAACASAALSEIVGQLS
jgi:hypothetical protein